MISSSGKSPAVPAGISAFSDRVIAGCRVPAAPVSPGSAAGVVSGFLCCRSVPGLSPVPAVPSVSSCRSSRAASGSSGSRCRGSYLPDPARPVSSAAGSGSCGGSRGASSSVAVVVDPPGLPPAPSFWYTFPFLIIETSPRLVNEKLHFLCI